MATLICNLHFDQKTPDLLKLQHHVRVEVIKLRGHLQKFI